MKVFELIKNLQACQSDQDVVIYDAEWGTLDNVIRIDSVVASITRSKKGDPENINIGWRELYHQGDFSPAYDEEVGTKRVVELLTHERL